MSSNATPIKTYFKHSGNIGDVIYSLPAIRTLVETRNIEAHLLLNLGQPMRLYTGAKHVNKDNQMISEEMFLLARPLFQATPFIKTVNVFNSATKYDALVIDLDKFRDLTIDLSKGDIVQWYENVVGDSIDAYRPWFRKCENYRCTPDKHSRIVVARSSRYRNPNINYSLLKQVPFTLVGHESEKNDFDSYPQVKFVQVRDFKETKNIIASSDLFIGNEGMPFAIAEGLKCTRLLEACLFADNVHPQGGKHYKAYTQDYFDYTIKKYIK